MKSKNPQINYKLLIRNFVIELVIYGGLVTLYFLLVLRLLSTPLFNLFNENLNVYAIVSLVLIVLQAVLLERLTSFLLDKIGLQRIG